MTGDESSPGRLPARDGRRRHESALEHPRSVQLSGPETADPGNEPGLRVPVDWYNGKQALLVLEPAMGASTIERILTAVLCYGLGLHAIGYVVYAAMRRTFPSSDGSPDIPVRSFWGVFNTLFILGVGSALIYFGTLVLLK